MRDLPTPPPGFTPVPVRARHDGWTPGRQFAYIVELAEHGHAGRAAQAVGMTEQSACRLRRKGDDGFAALFDLAGVTLRLTEVPGYTAPPTPVLGWEVPDMEAAVAALSANGVRMNIYEGLGQDEKGIWTAPDGSCKVAFFSDPDGNGLSLTQRIG